MIREITDTGLLDAMCEIENLSFPSPWSREIIEEDINKHNGVSRYLGLFENDRLIGWGCVFLLGEEAHLATVAIHPDYRGNGYGKKLVTALIDLSKEEGTQYMQLECRRSNEIAQNMYKSLGFFRFKVQKGYYTDTGEDALLFARLHTGMGG